MNLTTEPKLSPDSWVSTESRGQDSAGGNVTGAKPESKTT